MTAPEEAFVDRETFDLQMKLREEWKKRHPNGRLPDRIGFLLSEIRREWYKHDKQKSGENKCT